MRAGMRRGTGALAFVAAAALAAWLLYLLAGALTTHELRRAADGELGAWRSGASPWHWSLHGVDDVVAGHAFGRAQLIARDGTLQARSLDGSAYEIGLPLVRDADLQRAPRLRLALSTSQPLRLWLEVRQRAQAPLCLAALPMPAPMPRAATWRLDTLVWHRPDGTPCAVPVRAAELDLRLQQPSGSVVTLGPAALLPREGLQAAAAIALPADPAEARHVLEAATPPVDTLPVVRLPARDSPQHMLALRDLVHAVMPAAVVLPHGFDSAAAPVHAPNNAAPRAWVWLVLAAYALALLGLLVWPPRGGWRPWLEVAACMAGPLWLITGLHLRAHTAPVDLAAFALAIVFAIGMEVRASRADWRWSSGAARAWIEPLAMVLPTLLLLLWFARSVQMPDARHIMVYLVWAVLQQWLMLAVVGNRLRMALPSPVLAVFLCALLFALLHTPNARLMLLCFAAELWWARCFMRDRAVVPVALAHAICALLLQAGLSGGWLRSLEVSARYFLAP
jgi:hypothetical protein